MDEQETEQQEEEGEEEKVEAAPDPWKERALAAEDNASKAIAMLQQILAAQQQQQKQPLADVEPDYSDAEEVGMQPDQLRKIVAKAAAKLAPAIERAATPREESIDDRLDRVAEGAGVEGFDKFDAAREFDRARRTLGIQASAREVERLAVKTLKERAKEKINPAEEARRTSVTSGGSRPPGRRPAETQQKVETFVETIKKDQRKRGLYAY